MAGTGPGFNTFSNDGSFLEQFKRIQEQSVNQKAGTDSVGGHSLTAKPSVSIKLGVSKRPSGTSAVSSLKPRLTSSNVGRAFGGDSSDSESEVKEQSGACAKQGTGVHVHIHTHVDLDR